ncbi:aminoglycoside 3-N-acetyltransferase [Cohnella kolymensis]|uniref:Aminoglycoside N(3)-acetyltransferase n=1 Tax=Cohnella kolymensis TaxID=1590652 RepID=A0ABR5A3U4_9BACL|nr:aminoglycoside 3-N-acetyltransferase [Cohnella kolymensis]
MRRYSQVVTKPLLEQEFRQLGLAPGMTLIVHSSLSSLGWVSGGPVAVVQALMEVITDEGTLVMPAHSGEYSDPAQWENPPVPETWWDTIRATMPAFNPAYTPSQGMGAIVETFRSFPGVHRSDHPAVSFAAWGRHAKLVTEAHGLDFGLGEQSPLARIYDLDGFVLLIGVEYDSNTSFHLAENRLHDRKVELKGAPVISGGEREWIEYSEIEFETEVFNDIGAQFEEKHSVVVRPVASALCRLFKQRDGVDFAVEWFQNREGVLSRD